MVMAIYGDVHIIFSMHVLAANPINIDSKFYMAQYSLQTLGKPYTLP